MNKHLFSKKRSIWLPILFILFTTLGVHAQNAKYISIRGSVKDSRGEYVVGATIIVKELVGVGTATDINGQYSLDKVPFDATLNVTYIGMKAKEIKIQGKTIIDVVLKDDNTLLDEVVVVGYGTQKAKDLTGTIETVSSKDFQKVPLTNAEGLISSKMPGVQLIPSTGKPGAGSSFLVRGGASLSASNEPLIVIDNVPVEGGYLGPGILSQLNPDDIENFTLLKDASAAAIYGSRASNGVILITTKKGRKGRLKLNFSANTRIATIQKYVPVLSSKEYRELATQLGGSSTPMGNADTDWQKEIFTNALSTDYSLSASGAVNELPYRISVGYLDQDGILKTGNYKRITTSLNLNPVLFNNHLKINMSFKGSYENERLADESAIWSAIGFDPTQPVKVADPTFGRYFQYTQFWKNPYVVRGSWNPLSILEQKQDKNKVFRGIGNIQVDYSFHFLPDLHLNINGGLELSRSESSNEYPADFFPYTLRNGLKYFANPYRKVNNKLFETYLFYSKEIRAIKSKFQATLGYSYNDFLRTDNWYKDYDIEGNILKEPAFLYDKPSHSLISYYGRFNYALKERYLLTATVRWDGSSRFAKKYRWGVFPSLAFAWRIKEENFLKDKGAISDLKLRIGYGITGQQDLGDNYAHIPVYSIKDYQHQYIVGGTAYRSSLPLRYNPLIKWEQTATSNIGIDYALFNYRLSGSLDVYYKYTTDLLNETTIPLGYNYDNKMVLNVGSMENRGLELNIKGILVQKTDFNWDANFNFTYNENKILRLSNATNQNGVGLFSDATTVNTVGYPRGTFYLYQQVYGQDGYPVEDQMLDRNDDGLTNASDRFITGKSTMPKYMLGLSSNLSYKKWMFGISMHSNLGHYIFHKPLDKSTAITNGLPSFNLSTDYYKSRFSNDNQFEQFSDFYLQNASFLKLDNVFIAYDFGHIIPSFKGSLKFTISVQNVFTITKYTGQDPESTNGSQITYPIPRTFAMGININY